MKWKREELVGAVECDFPKECPELENDPKLDFIKDGMTPLQAMLGPQG